MSHQEVTLPDLLITSIDNCIVEFHSINDSTTESLVNGILRYIVQLILVTVLIEAFIEYYSVSPQKLLN